MFVGLVLADRYELIESLGSGGMGSVWRARDRTLNAEVAVKLMGQQFAESAEAVARFRREAQAAAAIRSTYVVQILDYGIDGGTPFIAMELLKGENLAQRLRREKTLPAELTGRFLGQVARALALSHSRGIVHRDMKPDNIFLVREEDEQLAKILDFGVARQTVGLADDSGLKTSTGAVMGTPYYMSPEQATGQPADHLTDIWSFGVIACECLTGKRAFNSQTLGGLFHAICMAPPPVPSRLGPVPHGFDAWFSRAVAREKSARFQSIREAADRLQTICDHSSDRPAAVSTCLETAHETIASAERTVPMTSPPTDAFVVARSSQTAAPSTHSIPGLPLAKRTPRNVLVLVLAALGLGLLFIGWRWGTRATPSTASAALETKPLTAASQPRLDSSGGASTAASALPAPTERPQTTVALPPASAQEARTRVPPPRPQPSIRLNRPASSPLKGTERRQPKRPIADDNVAGI